MAQSYVALRAVFGRRVPKRVSCSPSPQPSPAGEGETFSRALVIRPSLVVMCLRDERHRSGDCNRNLRIVPHSPNALPLLGERVGVRGNETNSDPRLTTTTVTVKLRESPGEPGNPNSMMRVNKAHFDPCKSVAKFQISLARTNRRIVHYLPFKSGR